MPNIDEFIDKGIFAIKKAGIFLSESYGGLKQESHTTDRHYTLLADQDTDKIITEILKNVYPGFGFITEEKTENPDSDYCWVIDSLDGTTNYSRNIPFFVTQAALLEKGEPIFSAIYAPVFDQLFVAIKNKGVTLNGQRVSISSETDIKKAIVTSNKGSRQDDLLWWSQSLVKISETARTVRHFGSTGLDLAYISSGSLDLHVNKGSQPYDVVPGAFMIKEAGGTFTDLSGNPWTHKSDSIVAGNAALHKQIIQILND